MIATAKIFDKDAAAKYKVKIETSLYEAPNNESKIVCNIKSEEKVICYGYRTKNWILVRNMVGKTGYIDLINLERII